MSMNHTRKELENQGHFLDDEALAEIGPWMRWPYVLCSSLMIASIIAASPWALWTLSTIALATVFLPSHPFNLPYNYVVRHLTGTRPLPPSTKQGKFACGIAGVWLIATGAAFYVGATTLGYVLGGALSVPAMLVATTQICIPSYVYNAIFDKKETQPA